MCLWLVKLCKTCEIISPIPTAPIYSCHNPLCYRITLDPNNLSEDEERHLLLNADRCCALCDYAHCGLVMILFDCTSDSEDSETDESLHSDSQGDL